MLSDFPNTHFVTCPVIGAPALAEKAQLLILMSGDYKSKQELAYILCPGMGRKVVDLGANVEKGQCALIVNLHTIPNAFAGPTLKLIANSIILGFNEVLAEALTMGEKSGVGAEAVLGFILDFYPNPSLNKYAGMMTYDKFDGKLNFALDGGLKDATHVRNLAAHHNAPMPIADLAYSHLLTARAIHQNQKASGTQLFDVLDWSALIAGPRVAAGLDGLRSKGVNAS